MATAQTEGGDSGVIEAHCGHCFSYGTEGERNSVGHILCLGFPHFLSHNKKVFELYRILRS